MMADPYYMAVPVEMDLAPPAADDVGSKLIEEIVDTMKKVFVNMVRHQYYQ